MKFNFNIVFFFKEDSSDEINYADLYTGVSPTLHELLHQNSQENKGSLSESENKDCHQFSRKMSPMPKKCETMSGRDGKNFVKKFKLTCTMHVLTTLRYLFCENFENIQQKSEEKNIIFFLKQFFSWKWSLGHVEWSFDKQARFFLPKIRKFFTLCLRMQMFEFSPIRKFHKKIPFGHLQFTFEDHVEKLSQETGKTSTWSPEMD